MRNTKSLGDLAELAFTYQAMIRGWLVSVPVGDNARYDRIVDNGTNLLRIQVKSAGVLSSSNRYNVSIGRHLPTGAVPYLSTEIDFLAIYIFPENRWFIVPVQETGGRVAVKIRPKDTGAHGPFSQFAEAWHVLEAKPRKLRTARR